MELWCEWGYEIHVNKRVTVFRKTNSDGIETIWNYYRGAQLSQIVLNEAASGLRLNLLPCHKPITLNITLVQVLLLVQCIFSAILDK